MSDVRGDVRRLMRHPDRIRAVCAALERRYGSPRHGNKANPLDELVFIILSNRTQDRTFRRTFLRLKAAYPSWRTVTSRSRRRIERALAPGGLGRLKTDQLVAIFGALRAAFGYPTLAPLRHLSNNEAEALLTSLPGVGPKVAKCVLMYSMDRAVLPVDVHVHRVASRLGLQVKRRPDTSQDLIETAVPPRFRYSFHVNAVAHGRTLCLPRRPECQQCPVHRWCTFFHERS
jgi:endonuclease III